MKRGYVWPTGIKRKGERNIKDPREVRVRSLRLSLFLSPSFEIRLHTAVHRMTVRTCPIAFQFLLLNASLHGTVRINSTTLPGWQSLRGRNFFNYFTYRRNVKPDRKIEYLNQPLSVYARNKLFRETEKTISSL